MPGEHKKKLQKRALQVINNRPLMREHGFRISTISKPKPRPNVDAKGNTTNLKAKEAAYKAMGGIAKYYEEGGEVLTGRQHNLPDQLKKKIIAAKKKKN